MGQKPRNKKPQIPQAQKQDESPDRYIVVDTYGHPVYGTSPTTKQDAERLSAGLLAPSVLKKVN